MHPQPHGRAETAVQDITDQIRKMKMAIERRVKANVPVDSSLIHLLIECAAVVIDGHQIGHDGKTLHRRAHQRDGPPSQFEFGEQVLARFAPKWARSKRSVPLAPRSTQGTWVGVHEPITENIFVLQSGKAVRVRIVFRRPGGERWNLERILRRQATPNDQNPVITE